MKSWSEKSAYQAFIKDFTAYTAELKKQDKYPKSTCNGFGDWDTWFLNLAYTTKDWQKDLLKECRRLNKELGLRSINQLGNINWKKRKIWKKRKNESP
jgi:hypothetical protein